MTTKEKIEKLEKRVAKLEKVVAQLVARETNKQRDSDCPDCLMGRDEFEPDWKCSDCRGETTL